MTPHPLDPLTADELRGAVTVLRTAGRLGRRRRLVSLSLDEPPKGAVRGYSPGDPIDRRAFAVVYDPDDGQTFEAVVALGERFVRSWRAIPGVQPGITMDEFGRAAEAVRADPAFRAGLERRGVTDPQLVHIEVWSIGSFAPEAARGRRLAWTPCWTKLAPGDNHYAYPLRGLYALVDLRSMEVVEVEDHGVTPLPPTPGDYTADRLDDFRTDLKPLEILQPEGPSFAVEGWEVRWQKWSFRIGFTQREGLVLHAIGYEDGGRVRSVCHRASIAELVIPYGDPSPGGYRLNAFDTGEYGLGPMTNSLELGCDCLGEIRYFDVDLAASDGEIVTLRNAICLHEEDDGLLWKHLDADRNRAEVRRARRLVVSSIVTVDNYEYAFYWMLSQDGSIEFEARLTGIVLTTALEPGEVPTHGTVVAPQLSALYHQHFFCARLDMDVDGERNTVSEVHTESAPSGPENPHGNAFVQVETPLRTELEAQRLVDSLSGRYWKIANPTATNGLGRPAAYRLMPGRNIVPFAYPDSAIVKRASFMTKHLWVTPFDPAERYPAGDYPNQHAGGAGLPEWTRANRPIEDTDVVVWYAFGSHHAPRPEDWPVMPVVRIGFHLEPLGFFDRNPALDVPPPRNGAVTHRAPEGLSRNRSAGEAGDSSHCH